MKAKLTRERLYSLQGIVTMGADVYKELDELEAKAAELDRREQGVEATQIEGNYGTCKCNYVATRHFQYCAHCGAKLIWPDN